MTVKERSITSNAIKPLSNVQEAAKKNERVTLSAEECSELLAFLSTKPEPLSIEIKRAIENYERIKKLQVE